MQNADVVNVLIANRMLQTDEEVDRFIEALGRLQITPDIFPDIFLFLMTMHFTQDRAIHCKVE
jgi:hypothetical protein